MIYGLFKPGMLCFQNTYSCNLNFDTKVLKKRPSSWNISILCKIFCLFCGHGGNECYIQTFVHNKNYKLLSVRSIYVVTEGCSRGTHTDCLE